MAERRKPRVSPAGSLADRHVPVLDPGALDLLRAELGEEFGDFLQRFGAGLPHRLRALEVAFARGDVRLIEALAHGLRGGSAWYGALLLARTCAGLERQAHSRKLEHARWLFGPLANEVSRVRAEIDRLFPSAPNLATSG